MGSKISNIEFVLAKKELDNNYFKDKFPDYDFEKFEKKVGIKKRYICEENESTLTLAVSAVNKLLKKTPFLRSEIDFIILCTQSPEFPLPTTACIVQKKCNLKTSIGALDINLGCSGYTYGISLAKGLIESGQSKKVLLVTSETYSKYINKDDLINQLIFGDAASATIIEYSKENKIGNSIFGTDGSGFDKLIVRNNFFNKQDNPEQKKYSGKNIYTDNNLFMDGSCVFNFTLERIPLLLNQVLQKNNLSDDDIDQYILHQANKFLLKNVIRKSNLDMSKLFFELENNGNTVSSSIPIALYSYLKDKKSRKLENILLAGFGVGLSWSGITIKI